MTHEYPFTFAVTRYLEDVLKTRNMVKSPLSSLEKSSYSETPATKYLTASPGFGKWRAHVVEPAGGTTFPLPCLAGVAIWSSSEERYE